MWCFADKNKLRVGADGSLIVTKPLAGAGTATLMDKQFLFVVPSVMVLFFTLMTAAYIDKAYDPNPWCNEDIQFEPWVHNVMAASCACAALTCVLQVIRIIGLLRSKMRFRNAPLVRVNLVLFVLNFFSGSAKMLFLTSRFAGVCVDKFGVYSPADQWVEWIILVPLLQYIACAVEQKTQLSTFDVKMLVLLTFVIFFGASMNLPGPLGLHIVFLMCAVSCLVGVTYMSVTNYRDVNAEFKGKKLRMCSYFPIKQTVRKALLLVQLNIILWYYPCVWVLGATGAIGADWTIALNMIGGIFGKVIFSSMVIESHVTLLYEYLVLTAANTQICDDDSVEPTPRSNATSTETAVLKSPRHGFLKAQFSFSSLRRQTSNLEPILDQKEDAGEEPFQRFESTISSTTSTRTDGCPV
ncbi:hypothetical protein B484DRAFT_482196 [Ochromonadaceae sp. CCMP2298]|nr:hypothetical protein B484DRAFT_482196 [Ochromonadaceae sp. CCMP2298]